MAKTLTLNYAGKEYTLEFTRRTVSDLERKGVTVNQLTEKPMTVLPELFKGAFLAHHRYDKNIPYDEIYAEMKDKLLLIEKLGEMYSEPVEALLEEPKEGNVDWTANF